jgi:NADPH2:quinone reductase
MRAVEVPRFGGPEVLSVREVAEPRAGPGEVVVAVAYADTLWVETAIRAGNGGPAFPVRPPYVAGVGVSGTVAEVGAGVDPALVGRGVVTRTGPSGGYVERALVPAEGLIPVPDAVGLDVAAALLHDGATASGLIETVRPTNGERVLVTAAGGGLGVLLVQLSKRAGAYVVAAARGPAKLDRLEPLADDTVDYDEPGWTDRVGAVDVVLDGAGGDYGRAAFDLVKPGGRFSAHGTPAGGFAVPDAELAAARGVTVTGIDRVQFAPADFRAHVAKALAADAVRPLIGQVFPLDRAADAHAAIEQRRAVGKTLLRVG